MGIFKAASAAAKGAMEDQWLEAFSCSAMDMDTLVTRGYKMQSERSANHGNENVISAGSAILVPDGACAIITEMGEVIACYDAPGEHKFTGEKARGIFGGGGLTGMAKDIGQRFTYGGDVPIVQRVYYVNTKEITNNPFSVSSMPVHLFDSSTMLDLDASVSASGVFSYRICDPVLFYKNVSGNVGKQYLRKQLHAQIQSELITSFAPALAAACTGGVRPYELAAHTEAICESMRKMLCASWTSLRGMEVCSIALESLRVLPRDQETVQQTQRAKALTDPALAAATLTAAQADAMGLAAGNPSGSALGSALLAAQANPSLWHCPCGTWNRGKFCENCGKPHVRQTR